MVAEDVWGLTVGVGTVVYRVIIHKNADAGGYWAESPGLGCFTDGRTLRETEINMFESVDAMLSAGGLETDYCLMFEIARDTGDE